MSWVDFEDFERAREWINEPQPHQVRDNSFYDDDEPPCCERCRRALDECECVEGGGDVSLASFKCTLNGMQFRKPRVERLRELHLLAVMHEMSADPCTPERAIRARRADRIAEALRQACGHERQWQSWGDEPEQAEAEGLGWMA